jgi:hypothetical protein
MLVYYASSSFKSQTWSAIPASIAGVMRGLRAGLFRFQNTHSSEKRGDSDLRRWSGRGELEAGKTGDTQNSALPEKELSRMKKTVQQNTGARTISGRLMTLDELYKSLWPAKTAKRPTGRSRVCA